MKKTLLLFVLFGTLACVNQAFGKNLELQYLFIYNFTKHIKWTDLESKSQFTIGIYNDDEAFKFFKNKFESSSRRAHGKLIKVIDVTNPEEARKCEIVYAPASRKKDVEAFVQQCHFNNTLLVTDYNLIDMGAHICFTIQGNKMNYLIKRSSIEQQGMKVSSQLISLGTEV